MSPFELGRREGIKQAAEHLRKSAEAMEDIAGRLHSLGDYGGERLAKAHAVFAYEIASLGDERGERLAQARADIAYEIATIIEKEIG